MGSCRHLSSEFALELLVHFDPCMASVPAQLACRVSMTLLLHR